ncbi:hypothetical protein RRF57_009713 [Xylaria bambusicola]|uniref:Uncharacterized protein n=1 Tax=Xylaria bambusicola TaxID=326684 RepID=A0AAN7UTX1_9PEZI
MQSKIILSLLLSTILAAPATEVVDIRAENPTLLEEYYNGPCSNTDCGVNRVNCRASRLWCVKYPSFDMPQGCTCSSL